MIGDEQTRWMAIPITPPHDYRRLFAVEDERLLALLRPLAPDDWWRPTPCPGWDVHGLALHLLGGALGVVSWLRDGFRGSAPPAGVDEAGFIAWIDELQVGWVDAARRISPRLLVELLAWSTVPFDEALAVHDPTAVTAGVSWASAEPVPVWLDHARELTEKWIHRQQLLQALDRPSDLRADLAVPVLDALRFAWPYRMGAHRRPPGAVVTIELVDDAVGRRWDLVSDGASWSFAERASTEPIASLILTVEQAWRLLTNNLDATAFATLPVAGDADLVRTLLQSRAIIGAPS